MKKLTTLKTLLVGLLALGATSAWGEEVSLSPVGVFTWTSAPAITYDASATAWAINQGGISGGKLGKYAGPYAIVKFDASSVLANMTLLTATLDFDITAGAYNSSMNIAQMAKASFDPSTVTTETFDASATQFQSGDWSVKNTTTHFSYDVTEKVTANNVLAFAIYTNTGREQTLKNVQLKLNYNSVPVAKYSYSLKAIKEGGEEIKTLVSGEEFETYPVTAYFPYMLYEGGVFYTTTQASYSITLDKDNTDATVVYSEASSDIVAYLEGESANVATGEDAAYSNGKVGYAGGNKPQAIATLPKGFYTATIYLAGNPNRSIVIRDASNSDNNSNTIVSLPISKTSPAGVYTSDVFELTESTTISFSGYTSSGKTNQSADIDYILIKKVIPTAVTVTISDEALYATYCSPYALDFSDVTGLAAYKATLDGSNVSFTSVSQVPANTGLLLQGNGGQYTIPVIESSPVEVESALVGVTEETVVDGAGIFVLLLGDQGVGFYKTTAEIFTVGANTAYIPALVNPSRSFIPVDETTAIKAIEDKQQQDGVVYNLAGQRVAKAQKGLYIIGGKKVIK